MNKRIIKYAYLKNNKLLSFDDGSKVLIKPKKRYDIEEVYNYLDSDKELANDKDDYDYCVMLISSIANNLEKYKAEVAKHLKKGWSLDRLSKMELAILLVGCYELLETDQSKEVIINEAVELSKKYCDDDVYKFVNGVLNKIK